MVSTVCLSTLLMDVRQEGVGRPFSSTVQARHSPSPQPYLVPVSCRSSLSTSSSGRSGSVVTVRDRPFRMKVILASMHAAFAGSLSTHNDEPHAWGSSMQCGWRQTQKGWEPCGAHPLHNLVVMSLCLFGHSVATAEDAAQPKADLRVLLGNRSIRQWHTLCVGQHVQPARCGRHGHLIAQWEVTFHFNWLCLGAHMCFLARSGNA